MHTSRGLDIFLVEAFEDLEEIVKGSWLEVSLVCNDESLMRVFSKIFNNDYTSMSCHLSCIAFITAMSC